MTTVKDLINEAIAESEGATLGDAHAAIMALVYYLYRQAGCPYGDTHERTLWAAM